MITRQDISKIASLARLSLSETETDKMTAELGQILTFVEKLNELDLKNVEATSHAVAVSNVFREDVVVDSKVGEAILKEAPQSEESFFTVPRIIG